jgi:hypothetical protein
MSTLHTKGVRNSHDCVDKHNCGSVKEGAAEWKEAAAAVLTRDHGICAGGIPQRVWTKLFLRRLNPVEAAGRAAIYFSRIRPAGLLWRKKR